DISLEAGTVSFLPGGVIEVLGGIENIISADVGDRITGDGAANTLNGAGGDDTIFGGAGDDALFGGGENDTLNGGDGADSLDGGEGIDAVSYADAASEVTASLSEGAGLGGAAFGDMYQSIENLIGSGFDDTLSGDGAANTIEGGAGNDQISGFAGADTLKGGAGDDQISGGSEDDLMFGGEGGDSFDGGLGIDTVSFGEATARVQADLRGSTAQAGEAIDDSFTDVENLTGSAFNDTLRGDNETNILRGGNGIDRLFGQGGDDTLFGEAGNDLLYGNSGADVMTGGAGDTRYIYFDVSDSRAGAGLRDTITDFNADGTDRLELFRIDADETTGGNQAFTFIGTAAFSNSAGELRIGEEDGNSVLQADVDGDGGSDFEIAFEGIVTVVEADILL
ncbi:MAG: calcium-binding protein, partial [Pseudomonadota bacterium]